MDNTRVKELFAKLERSMRSEFIRFKLSHRQQNLATIIAEQSFGRESAAVCIPTLGVFGDLTGFPKGAICEALQDLLNMRIIDVRKTNAGPEYRINTETEKWQVAPRRMPVQVQRALDLIQRFNQAQSEPNAPIKNLKAELGEYLQKKAEDGEGNENSDGCPVGLKTRVVVLDSGMSLETEIDLPGMA